MAFISLALAGCADAPPLAPVSRPSYEARPASIENRYIVLFRNDVADPTALTHALLAAHGGNLGHIYKFALKGFAVANLPPQAVEALRRNPLIRYVEPARDLRLYDYQQLPLTASTYRESLFWALDRVDERPDVFNGRYEYSHCGQGTHIYIVDTGIRGTHVEWQGRVGTSAAFIAWSWNPSPTIDQRGHGTGVAGAAAGSTVGIAKCATIHSVRVDDGGGFPCPDGPCEEDVVAGIDWVAGNHQSPAVMNVSIEGSFAMADALEGAINAGVIAIKAAGNDGVDAYQDRGNRARGLIVVGASDRDDLKSIWPFGLSNYGSLVTLFAPGTQVYSAHNDSDNAAARWNGTSFAAPLTAGVAALILQQEPGANQARVRDVLVSSATNNELSGDLGAGSANRLLFSHITVVPPPPPPAPLTTVSIGGPTQIQPGATCTWQANVSDGTPPYSYQWVNDWMQAGNGYEYTGSKLPDNTGSSFRISVTVTDAGQRQGSHEITVFENSSAPVCFQ